MEDDLHVHLMWMSTIMTPIVLCCITECLEFVYLCLITFFVLAKECGQNLLVCLHLLCGAIVVLQQLLIIIIRNYLVGLVVFICFDFPPILPLFLFINFYFFCMLLLPKKQQHYFGIYFCFDSKSRKYFILVFVRPFVWQCKYDIIPGRYVVGMFVVFFFLVLAFVLIKQIKVMFTVLCLSQPKRHGHRPLSV